jgi:hypothetical protein
MAVIDLFKVVGMRTISNNMRSNYLLSIRIKITMYTKEIVENHQFYSEFNILQLVEKPFFPSRRTFIDIS